MMIISHHLRALAHTHALLAVAPVSATTANRARDSSNTSTADSTHSTQRLCMRLLRKVVGHRTVTIFVCLGIFVGSIFLMKGVGTGSSPLQDNGRIGVDLQLRSDPEWNTRGG